MFEYAQFVVRNPAHVAKYWRQMSITRRNMLDFRAANGACYNCGRTKGLQVHHIKPVAVAPACAADPRNMLVLCSNCHLRLAHNGDYARRYVPNIVEVCDTARIVKVEKADHDSNPTYPTDGPSAR